MLVLIVCFPNYCLFFTFSILLNYLYFLMVIALLDVSLVSLPMRLRSCGGEVSRKLTISHPMSASTESCEIRLIV